MDDDSMTTNDLETNELLIKVYQYQQLVSHYVRAGDLRKAAEKASDLHALTRSLDARINALYTKNWSK